MDNNIREEIEKWLNQNMEDKNNEIINQVIEMIGDIQMTAFMDGYVYAISVLEDGLIKEKTN